MQIILQRATDVLPCTIMVRSQDEVLRLRLTGSELHTENSCALETDFLFKERSLCIVALSPQTNHNIILHLTSVILSRT